MIFAIDPGPLESGFVILTSDGQPCRFGIHPNVELLPLAQAWLGTCPGCELVVEMVASYGMTVGKEVFETVLWAGRFVQAWAERHGAHHLMYRRDVKMHLCNNNHAKDANVRQALLDRFGPGKDRAIGTKKAQGPLYGISGHVWSALALAVTFSDRQTKRAA